MGNNRNHINFKKLSRKKKKIEFLTIGVLSYILYL